MSVKKLINRKLPIKGTRKASTGEENITIRLSDLGIVKRSPSELDLQIQGVRIGAIFETTIGKLQMAVCLPRLLRKDACLLRRALQTEEVEFILAICSKYLSLAPASRLDRTSLAAILSSIDNISMNDPKRKYMHRYSGMTDCDHFVDPHMGQVMEILWNNRSLKEKVLAEFPLIPRNPSTVLVNCVISLKELADYKFNMSAVEEKTREQQLRKAWKANSLLDENIRSTQQLLDKQRQELGEQLESKRRIVKKYENKIDTLQNHFKDTIRHKIQDAEREMADDSQSSQLRQGDLAAEAKAVTQQFESLLSQHLAYEKGLRAKRFKVETQLSSWLSKYDADIGERQAEFEEITKGFEEEKAEMHALQDKFNEQEEEYVVLMAEKEEEERKIWEEKAYAFLKNRSARRIQICWRAYRQRKIDRKKAKKAKAKAKKQKSAEKIEGEGAEAGEGGGGDAGAAEQKEKAGKDKKGAKGKGKGKGKKEQLPPSDGRGPDFQAALDNKYGDEVMGELKGPEFSKQEVVVHLSADTIQ